MATADRAQLIAELLLDDKFTRPLNRIDKRLGAFSGAVNRNLGRGIDTAVTAVARGVVNIGRSVVTAAVDWEDAFQGVVKTVEATPAQFDAIAEGIRGLARDMPVAATELAAIAEQGGAMGIAAGDIEAFTKQVAILGSTTDVSTTDAATALGQLQNVVGLTGDEFDNFSAALVDLGNKGASTESQILEIARRAGGAAKLFGIGKDAILGWASAAANLGLNPELAGTALQNVFVKLMPAVNKGSKTLRTVLGKSAKEVRKLFEKDAGKGLELFIKKLAKLPKSARLEAIQKVFGKTSGITRLLLGLTGDVDNLTESLDTSADAWDDASAAQTEFDKRNATVRSAFTRLRNNITDAAISIGEGFAPALGRAADKLSAFLKVPANRTALENLGKDIGRIIDDVDWDGLLADARSFMGALEKAGGFASTLWDAFSNIPSDAKAVLLSLAGLEKLSGGAVSGIVGDIGKGLFEQFASRGSSPANPLWVQMIGTTPGVPGVPLPGGKPPTPGGIVKPAIGAAVSLDMVEAQRHTNESLRRLESKGLKIQNAPWNRPGADGKNPSAGTIPNDPTGFLNSGAGQKLWAAQADTLAEQIATKNAIRDQEAAVVAEQSAAKKAVASAVETGAAVGAGATRTGAATMRTATYGAAGMISGAVRASRDVWNIRTVVNVSASGVTSAQTSASRSSKPSSRSDDNYDDHR